MQFIIDQKDHKCDTCGKTSSSARDLRKHINTVHNEQKDHKCDSCGKAFSQAWILKKHIDTVHNGKKITNVTYVESHFLKQEH